MWLNAHSAEPHHHSEPKYDVLFQVTQWYWDSEFFMHVLNSFAKTLQINPSFPNPILAHLSFCYKEPLLTSDRVKFAKRKEFPGGGRVEVSQVNKAKSKSRDFILNIMFFLTDIIIPIFTCFHFPANIHLIALGHSSSDFFWRTPSLRFIELVRGAPNPDLANQPQFISSHSDWFTGKPIRIILSF